MYQHGSLAATGAVGGLMGYIGFGLAGVVIGIALLVLVKLLRPARQED